MGQTGKNILVAFKKEATFGVAAGTSGGKILRLNPSPGLDLQRTLIRPNEFRKDGMTPLARLGSKSVTGSYDGDLSASAFDEFFEAIMRATWAAILTATSADFTTVAISGTNTLTWAVGNPITKGFRVGDVFRISGSANTTNHNKWFRIVALTATTMVVPTGELANQAADGGLTLTRPKKLLNGGTPVRASFTIEEYLQDIDDGEQFLGVRAIQMQMGYGADQMVGLTLQLLGQTGSVLGAANAPYFTTPTLPTGLGLIATDAKIRLNGIDVANLTAAQATFDLGGRVEPMIGALISPDVFENDLKINGQVTGLRQDLANVTLFNAETEFELSFLLQTPTGTPPDMFSVFLPKVKLSSAGAPLGADGGQIETLNFEAGLRDAASGYDATMASMVTSAA